MNNGKQFDNAKFKQFCSNLKIHLCFATPVHSQSNGRVKAVNKIIKRTLKTKFDKTKDCWLELLQEVLWSYRTTFRPSIGETPFYLFFGAEAVVPVEIGQPSHRTRKVSLVTKNSAKGTLSPTKEGPYEVIKVCIPCTYQLRGSNNKPLPHPWNTNHLKYYYK
ncbi:hypothetical protein L3X38_032715 [Prunus dulcis]|uniref:Integrase catalytic domain-containing protein n=1 Tax=Prunus dulcis TaxID=3755 RepID=A0AAD4VEV3_PRUDU|nr:hypothetical protein L3X38_032715 [Prunus dulcis]